MKNSQINGKPLTEYKNQTPLGTSAADVECFVCGEPLGTLFPRGPNCVVACAFCWNKLSRRQVEE